MNFSSFLNESVINQYVYHASDRKFKKFNMKKLVQPIIWFTSNKDELISKSIHSSGNKYIYTLKVDIKNPIGWKEYQKLTLYQIESFGYDGAILRNNNNDFHGFVFNPDQITIISIE